MRINPLCSHNSYRQCLFAVDDVKDLPETFDWRDQNAVSKIKDQGTCGDCFIFASVGALESQYMIHENTEYAFSEQSILNCNSDGCNGGSMGMVWKRIHEHGICTADEMPYHGEVGFGYNFHNVLIDLH